MAFGSDSVRTPEEKVDNSFSEKLHSEVGLLASIPGHIGSGVISRLQDVLDHKNLTAIELAASFGVAVGLTFASKNPGLIGDVARFTPKLFLGLTALDIGRRFGGPMIDTWRHPANLERDKQWLGNNLGSALVDYPLVAAAGYGGDRLSSGLIRRIGAPATLSEWNVPTFKDLLTEHGKIFGRHSLNAPIVDGMQTVEQKIYPDGGINPNFPHQIDGQTAASFAELKVDQPAFVITSAINLTPTNKTASFGIRVDNNGPVRLDLDMSAPGTNWAKAGAESAVLSVFVDGKYSQDAVLFGGSDKTKYSLALHELSAGNHTITLRYAEEKSPRGAQGVVVDSGTATAYGYKDKLTQAIDENSPVLYGRHGTDNNHTDTPMGMYHSEHHNPDGTTTIDYGYVFSNEDGGTAILPAVENARWGRMTDIQHVFKVTVDANGKVLSRLFDGPNHVNAAFNGTFEGTHPVIQTSTDNNNVSDSGTGPLKFSMLPDYAVPSNAPVEDLQRQNPLWWKTSSVELDRERKVARQGKGDLPNDSTMGSLLAWFQLHTLNDPPQMADPRNYLYVQMDLQNAAQNPVAARVILKNGTTSSSDFGFKDVAIGRNGWSQTSLLLPPGTKESDIAKVEFVARGGTGKPEVLGVGHLYMLDQKYAPSDVSVPVAPQVSH
jgi:hypothetical protein